MPPRSSSTHRRASSPPSARPEMGLKENFFSMDFQNGASHWHNKRLQRIAIFAFLSLIMIGIGLYRNTIYETVTTPAFSIDSIVGLHKFNPSKIDLPKLPFLKDTPKAQKEEDETLYSMSDPYVHVAKVPSHDHLVALDHTRVALLIETRPLPHLPALILHFIGVLPLQWTVRFMGSIDVIQLIERSRPLQAYLETGKLLLIDIPPRLPVKTQQGLSEVFTSLEFYRDTLAPVEWLLTFQSDSIICAASELSLDDWVDLNYTYIGAPWNMGTIGGNGGLSLRHVPEIIDLLSDPSVPPRKKGEERFEDRWLSDMLGNRTGTHMANGSITNHFSVESVWSERPLGYHLRGSGAFLDDGIWRNATRRERIFKYCPEVKIILESVDLEGYGGLKKEEEVQSPVKRPTRRPMAHKAGAGDQERGTRSGRFLLK